MQVTILKYNKWKVLKLHFLELIIWVKRLSLKTAKLLFIGLQVLIEMNQMTFKFWLICLFKNIYIYIYKGSTNVAD